MNSPTRITQRSLTAALMLLCSVSRSHAEEPKDIEPAQLQRNLHDMRVVMERERAQQEGAARVNTQQLQVQSIDAPGIGMMREQLARSLERLENRCFGIDMNVKDGNAILICGNNAGVAENSTVKNTSSATNTVIKVPQIAPTVQPTTTPVQEGK